jgi:hypothetical protein
MFYTLQTESNHTISLTAEHLIPVASNDGTLLYIPAAHVKVGHHSLYVLSNNRLLVRSPVIRVSIETKRGYYAPLTTTGMMALSISQQNV